MVVTSIAVVGTIDDISYTGPYPKTEVPSETTVEMRFVVQLGTKEDPRTEGGSIQTLLDPLYSLNMHLPFYPP